MQLYYAKTSSWLAIEYFNFLFVPFQEDYFFLKTFLCFSFYGGRRSNEILWMAIVKEGKNVSYTKKLNKTILNIFFFFFVQGTRQSSFQIMINKTQNLSMSRLFCYKLANIFPELPKWETSTFSFRHFGFLSKFKSFSFMASLRSYHLQVNLLWKCLKEIRQIREKAIKIK